MQEKIIAERPRAFASGFMIPFHEATGRGTGGTRRPVRVSVEASTAELLRDHRRMAFHIASPESMGALDALDAFALDTLIQKNPLWFKNHLSDDAIRAMVRPSRNPEGYLTVRCSPDHFPKVCRLNGRPVADWGDLESQWFKRPGVQVERVVAELVCHGIYLKKQTAELLWKIQEMSVFLYEPNAILEATDIDEYKEDIENDWAARLDAYTQRMEKEIQALEDRIRQKRDKRAHLVNVLNGCRSLRTADPEWNTSIEYLGRELGGI